jgi:type I restriction enzyme R subunit
MPLSEADTIAKHITPALYQRGWTEEHIRREENAGENIIVRGKPRKGRKRIDLTLRVRIASDTQPVAVALIEAKKDTLPPTHGLEQAKLYASATRLNVPFVYSSNGHLFVEYDRFTGMTTQPRPMTAFPTPDDLRYRYEQHMGFSLEDETARPLVTRYHGGEEGARRYYQDAALRAALEKLARGEKRVLLSLATGSGKTRIAVNLLRRIADARQLGRALFVCDRDELRRQAQAAFQNVFGNDAAVVTSHSPQKNARILIATYQTLDVDTDEADANFLMHHYPPDYFSHIIIDEAHRSAWGKWSQVLTRNPNAVQVGLTATPRELEGFLPDTEEGEADLQITADNIAYFGEPVYEYDIGQGIEDGYLAACEIVQSTVNLDETGITLDEVLALSPTDALTGEPITADDLRAIYERTSFEDAILLPDRVLAMCADLFNYLLQTGERGPVGPLQKTIIYCVRDSHADAVAITMNNLYARWCAENGHQRLEPYAFKCTAAASGGDYLADLRGSARSHFIATTVDLLTTGVDVPRVQNIVFFRYINSPILFYQMIGRGTRLFAPTNKLMFRVYDYTNATRLFGEEFKTKLQARDATGDREPIERDREPVVNVEGFEVRTTEAGRFILATVEGKAVPMTVEEYREMLAERLTAQAPTLSDFRTIWIDPLERQEMMRHLPEQGRSALLVQALSGMDDYDLYDVLGELGYGLNPLTRSARAEAFGYKHITWLAAMPTQAAETLRTIAAQFARGGTEALESAQVFQVPEVTRAGGLEALRLAGNPRDLLHETKARMFAA